VIRIRVAGHKLRQEKAIQSTTCNNNVQDHMTCTKSIGFMEHIVKDVSAVWFYKNDSADHNGHC